MLPFCTTTADRQRGELPVLVLILVLLLET
jgi:hypothetical protein